ncbi:extracellular solute-binding protein (plasmid) [Haladaptatus sp. SPP-AMP-3]|uniref:extracellular solute-binding protein n=1 Tax=Haladaptatus sp. SPP-AMP-3 TaxID=3121295 RepID=UPI003C2D4EEE
MTQNDANTTESNGNRISRRHAIGTGGAVLTTALAGCSGLTGGGGSDSDNSGKSGDVNVDYWMYFGAQEKKEMTELVDEFNKKDNGIHINAQSVPFGSFLNKLFTAVNSGNAPHIASYYASYGRHLKPITDPIDDYLSSKSKSAYFDIARENTKIDGDTYALPIDVHGKGLYTNDKVLEKAGVDPDFSDWDSFSNAANTIKKKTDARPFSFINWKAGQAAYRAYIIALTQAGGNVLTGEPGDYKVAFDNEKGMETAQLMTDITGKLGWDSQKFQSESARVEDFVSGKLGMFIAGTWSVNNFENENGEIPSDLSFTFQKPFMFPGEGDDVAWAESNSLYFPTNSNHTEEEKKAAVEFAEFATQNNTLWASAGGHLPAAKSVATSKKVKNTKLWTEFDTISTMYEMVKDKQVRYQPRTGIHINSDKFWGPFIDMYLHNTSVKKGVKNSATSLQQALDRQ